MKIDNPGIYYGQCSMICGKGHGYMPIVIEGVHAGCVRGLDQEQEQDVGEGIFLNAPHSPHWKSRQELRIRYMTTTHYEAH